jgi:hypothetical protein
MTNQNPRSTRPDRMQPAEFRTLCEAAFGRLWKRPASRALHRDPKMIARYADGEAVVPLEVSTQLKEIAEVGDVERTIKPILLKAFSGWRHPDGIRRSPEQKSHIFAKEIATALRRKTFVVERVD